MVDANLWLNAKIPKHQRAQITLLHIYRQCQSGHTIYYDDCNYCNYQNNHQSNQYNQYNNYTYYGAFFLEGELDLDDFINLQELRIYGTGTDQGEQKLNLKIDKCSKLTHLMINNAPVSNFIIGEDKRLINRLTNQVEKLTSIVRDIKGFNIRDIKLAAKKIEEENLKYQISVIKSKLTEDCQLLLEILLETQQEVLQNDSTFARKQLEKVKKRLSNVLTAEEIQNLLGKKVEINELEVQLNKLNIKENLQQ
ncbi:24246_t:CDS:1 [Gigaspora margarita]|uniref:24246_t:CDS:1 n=1 Tax=Gigaspora margarita TaxID=4874 RepID=A0ABN7UWE0_GIGMA|nr:24246_t:CDS:1 [Gigaspora margarita]